VLRVAKKIIIICSSDDEDEEGKDRKKPTGIPPESNQREVRNQTGDGSDDEDANENTVVEVSVGQLLDDVCQIGQFDEEEPPLGHSDTTH